MFPDHLKSNKYAFYASVNSSFKPLCGLSSPWMLPSGIVCISISSLLPFFPISRYNNNCITWLTHAILPWPAKKFPDFISTSPIRIFQVSGNPERTCEPNYRSTCIVSSHFNCSSATRTYCMYLLVLIMQIKPEISAARSRPRPSPYMMYVLHSSKITPEYCTQNTLSISASSNHTHIGLIKFSITYQRSPTQTMFQHNNFNKTQHSVFANSPILR